MVALTIRNVDENLKRRIKTIAAANGRSMEAEALEMLRRSVTTSPTTPNVGQSIRKLVESVGGIELQIPPRKSSRKPPKFA